MSKSKAKERVVDLLRSGEVNSRDVTIILATKKAWDAFVEDMESLGYRGSRIIDIGGATQHDTEQHYDPGHFRPLGSRLATHPLVHPYEQSMYFRDGGNQQPAPPITTFPAEMDIDRDVVQELAPDIKFPNRGPKYVAPDRPAAPKPHIHPKDDWHPISEEEERGERLAHARKVVEAAESGEPHGCGEVGVIQAYEAVYRDAREQDYLKQAEASEIPYDAEILRKRAHPSNNGDRGRGDYKGPLR